jgi:antitoxin FitA
VATLTIPDVDDELKAALRVRAAKHGRSMEAEVREILASVLKRPPVGPGMGTRIRQRFSGGDADIELPARAERPRAASFVGDRPRHQRRIRADATSSST